MDRTGFEAAYVKPCNDNDLRELEYQCAAEYGAVQTKEAILDDDLPRIVNHWAELSDHIKQLIMALVEALRLQI